MVQVCASILTLIAAGVGRDDAELLDAYEQRQARQARLAHSAAATSSTDAQKPPRGESDDALIELSEEEPPPRRVWDDDQIESLAKMLKRNIPEGARSLEVLYCHCSCHLVLTPTALQFAAAAVWKFAAHSMEWRSRIAHPVHGAVRALMAIAVMKPNKNDGLDGSAMSRLRAAAKSFAQPATERAREFAFGALWLLACDGLCVTSPEFGVRKNTGNLAHTNSFPDLDFVNDEANGTCKYSGFTSNILLIVATLDYLGAFENEIFDTHPQGEEDHEVDDEDENDDDSSTSRLAAVTNQVCKGTTRSLPRRVL